MKIRSGFVSNSSSCSFIICGFKLSDNRDKIEIVKKLTGKTEEDLILEMLETCYYRDKTISDITSDDMDDYCSELLYGGRIGVADIEMGEGVDGIVIGKNISSFEPEVNDLHSAEIDIDELLEEVKCIRNTMGPIETPIRIYTGTKCC